MEEGEFRLLEQQGIKALMAVPLVANDTVKGFMGVDLVDRTILWSNEDYQWLGSLANIISICVELRKTRMRQYGNVRLWTVVRNSLETFLPIYRLGWRFMILTAFW